MMRKIVPLILLLICLAAGASFAQVVHVKGVQSVEAGYGMSAYGYQLYAGYVRYFSGRMYGKAAGYYWLHEDRGSKVVSFGLDITPAYNILRGGESFYLNAIGGLTVGVDKLETPLTIYDSQGNASQEDYGALKFGVLGGVEMEYFISDRFVLILGGTQRLMFGNTDLGSQRWVGYGGIRFNL